MIGMPYVRNGMKYVAGAAVGAALGLLAWNEWYVEPRVQRLEEQVLAEQGKRERLQSTLQKYSLPVDEGFLKMTIGEDGKPVFWNKLQAAGVPIDELSREYRLVKR